jgi:hypothetical protein
MLEQLFVKTILQKLKKFLSLMLEQRYLQTGFFVLVCAYEQTTQT